MFWHVFVNQFKIILRRKEMLFWVILIPVILATFFNLAFSNLTSQEKFKSFDIAIVESENYQNDKNFQALINQLSTGKNKIINYEIVNEKKALEKLNSNKITAYLDYQEKIEIVVNDSNTNVSILKGIVDNYYQTNSIITNILSYRPFLTVEEVMAKYNAPTNFFENESSKNTDYTVIYFYSLIGMACLYSASFSMFAINRLEANNGAKGARMTVSSAPKYIMILSSLLASFIIQFLSLLILLAYLIFILKINFGNDINLIMLVCFVGTIVSSMLGIFVSTLFKTSVEKKTGIIISYTMVCSFLAGMMFIDMRYIIADKLPFLANINPVNLITDSLYAIYYYSEPTKVYINLFLLLLFAFILLLLSISSLRRKRYDSI